MTSRPRPTRTDPDSEATVPTARDAAPRAVTTCSGWRRPARSTTASPPWSAACSTTPSPCSPTSSTPSSGSAASVASTPPTSRCSPTACAPSASRASRSTSPTATSRPPTRSFVLADTPGHVQYTRNMVTGASTAELALILIDARHGVVEQTRRHLAVTGLLRRAATSSSRSTRWTSSTATSRRFDDDRRRVRRHAARSASTTSRPSRSRPSSATTSSTAPTARLVRRAHPARAPRVRPGRHRPRPPSRCACRCSTSSARRAPSTRDYRGYAGRLASGVVRPGDEVTVLPGGAPHHRRRHRPRRQTARRVARRRLRAAVGRAAAGRRHRRRRAATSRRADEPSLPTRRPRPARSPSLVRAPAAPRRPVLLRVGTRTVRALVDDIVDQLDLARCEHADRARRRWRSTPSATSAPAGRRRSPLDDYRDLRRTGAFLLIDEADGSHARGWHGRRAATAAPDEGI